MTYMSLSLRSTTLFSDIFSLWWSVWRQLLNRTKVPHPMCFLKHFRHRSDLQPMQALVLTSDSALWDASPEHGLCMGLVWTVDRVRTLSSSVLLCLTYGSWDRHLCFKCLLLVSEYLLLCSRRYRWATTGAFPSECHGGVLAVSTPASSSSSPPPCHHPA